MKILFVMDQLNNKTNGTTISARCMMNALKERGHQVKAICVGEDSDEIYGVSAIHVPIFNFLISNQGMHLAKPDNAVINKAIDWAELIHIFMPFPLGCAALKIAQKRNKAVTAAFHVQPENITYNIHLSHFSWTADMIYRYFRDHFYNHVSHVHCPSEFMANELLKRGYHATIHTISNGVSDIFNNCKQQKPQKLKENFCILMIGRLSSEKRQNILIKAVANSRYKDRIQIIFAGDGPKKRSLQKLGALLPNPPIIRFFKQEDLQKVMSYCDLYVHTSVIESESISTIEAICSGLVPVIADSSRSAASQFALNPKSLFPKNDISCLQNRIDYWIEHPQKRKEMEQLYAQHGKNFSLEKSVEKMELMFHQACEEAYG